MRYALVMVLMLGAVALGAGTTAPAGPGGAGKKITLAVLPFVYKTDAEKTLAEKMRYAVREKMSADGRWDRKDQVEVDQTISALGVLFSEGMPEEDDLKKVVGALGVEQAVTGAMEGRKLSLTMYDARGGGWVKGKTISAEIPPGTDSPRLTVEKLLTELSGQKFEHIREVECDHSDPAVEKLWKERPNLVLDPGFEEGAKIGKAVSWGVILGADRYAPPVVALGEAQDLKPDRVAVVPKAAAGDAGNQEGYCLMMRMSKDVAENNGLACESIWVPVEHGKKYRFSCDYHSTGPVPRLFLKGFAEKADQFGDKKDLEAVRREYYRAQILPRKANERFEPIEMDFTPSVLKEGQGLQIQWIRVDLYIYLKPGDVFFDNVVVKKISP